MALELNRIEIIGQLVQPPEINVLPTNGTKVARLRFRVTDSVKNRKTDTIEEQVNEFEADVFGKGAEYCQKYMTHGSIILIMGRLGISRWTGKDGQPKKYLRIVVHSAQVLRNPPKGQGGGPGATARPTSTSSD